MYTAGKREKKRNKMYKAYGEPKLVPQTRDKVNFIAAL